MYLIFTPLFYVNGNPHVGHLYNIYIVKMFGRYLSASGKSYITITGTDEHGEKVYKSYLEYIVKTNKKNFSLDDYRYMRRDAFKECFGRLDSCMIYHTHSIMHITYVKYIFNFLKDKKIIYQGKYVGYYSLREEKYVDEQEYASLDEDEKNFFIIKKEENGYYLKLDHNIKEKIIENIDQNVISEEYIEYTKKLVRNANDMFISRECKDVEKESKYSIYCEKNNVCLYVWFDAILYYCAILRVYNYKIFKPIIVIGKDIQIFHVSLLLHISYHLFGYFPFKLVVHGMITSKLLKISKSHDNNNVLKNLEEKYEDLFYSYLLSKDLTKDSDVNEECIVQYLNFIKNNVRNCYKRYFSLLETYKASVSDWYILANNLLDHVEHKNLMQLFYDVYNLDVKLNGYKIYNILVKASAYANKIITEKEFWNHSSEKEIDFFIVGNYLRLMVLLESILCTPGIENIYQILQENITASLSMATKMLDMKVQDIKMLDLDVFASCNYRKKLKEKEIQQQQKQQNRT